MSKRRTNPAESAAQGEVLRGLHSVLGVGLDTFTTISYERKRGPQRGLASERAGKGDRRRRQVHSGLSCWHRVWRGPRMRRERLGLETSRAEAWPERAHLSQPPCAPPEAKLPPLRGRS